MTITATSFSPRTSNGRLGVGLGFGAIVVVLLLFVVSNIITDGGSQAAPLWLRATVPGAVLAITVPALITGFRSRRTDPSTLGTIALVIAGVLGGWSAVTGVAGLFL